MIGWSEALRGTSHWVAFITTGGRGWWPAAHAYAFEPLLILVAALVTAIGLLGLVRYRDTMRVPLVAGLALGLAAMTVAHGGWEGSPLSGFFLDALEGPLQVFRNVHKVDPTVRFAVAMGFAAAVAEASLLGPARAGCPGSGRSRCRVSPPSLVLVLGQPFLVNNARTPGWEEVPAGVAAGLRLPRAAPGRHQHARRAGLGVRPPVLGVDLRRADARARRGRPLDHPQPGPDHPGAVHPGALGDRPAGVAGRGRPLARTAARPRRRGLRPGAARPHPRVHRLPAAGRRGPVPDDRGLPDAWRPSASSPTAAARSRSTRSPTGCRGSGRPCAPTWRRSRVRPRPGCRWSARTSSTRRRARSASGSPAGPTTPPWSPTPTSAVSAPSAGSRSHCRPSSRRASPTGCSGPVPDYPVTPGSAQVVARFEDGVSVRASSSQGYADAYGSVVPQAGPRGGLRRRPRHAVGLVPGRQGARAVAAGRVPRARGPCARCPCSRSWTTRRWRPIRRLQVRTPVGVDVAPDQPDREPRVVAELVGERGRLGRGAGDRGLDARRAQPARHHRGRHRRPVAAPGPGAARAARPRRRAAAHRRVRHPRVPRDRQPARLQHRADPGERGARTACSAACEVSGPSRPAARGARRGPRLAGDRPAARALPVRAAGRRDVDLRRRPAGRQPVRLRRPCRHPVADLAERPAAHALLHVGGRTAHHGRTSAARGPRSTPATRASCCEGPGGSSGSPSPGS